MSTHPIPRARFAAFSALALAITLQGCKCGSDKPYTPFGVASSLPSVRESAAPPPSSSALLPPFPEKKAVAAPAQATRVKLGEREIESPAGQVFDQILSADFDGDTRDDALVFTRPAAAAKPEAAPGELYLYAGEAPPKKLLDWPSFLPSGPSCTPEAAIVQPSPRSVVVDLKTTCTAQLVARAPTRAVVLLDPTSSRPFTFGVRAADAAPGEALSIELVARDADGDGRDDPALRVAASAAGAEPLYLDFAWFDRAAGPSRDTRLPSRALVAELDADGVRAVRKKSAARALARVDSARRALFSACAEGGTPRVFDWDGNALRCDLSPDVIDRLGAVAVSARLTEGDLAGAAGALARDGWYFGALRPQKRVALLAELEKRLPPIPVNTVAFPIPTKTAPRPHYSPLWFEADGSLLIQTPNGVSRVPPGGDSLSTEPDSGDRGWPLEIRSGADQLTGVVYSCDRSEVQLLTTSTNTRLLPTSLLSPRPGVCRGGTFSDPSQVAGIAATEGGFELIVAGARVHTGGGAGRPPHGSARSQDGKLLALASPLGLLIAGEKTELWKIDGWAVMAGSDCVVANGGRRAACVRANRVELYTR